ncbi:hypothetical protein FJT64_025954 [Amphibalanus amphitrite]|uniref:Uncharacterized protein n=1 Tax=Amphibalanus amphitrite TaxID=1232801 RepID=A0A6A4W9I3_AMPAM|nr:hypothetical protein FJT64_025954 [Amphibalanus amphitrite]
MRRYSKARLGTVWHGTVWKEMRGRVYPAPATPMGLLQGGGGAGGGYGPPRYMDGPPTGQLSLQVRYSAQPGYQPAPYRHQAPTSLPVSTATRTLVIPATRPGSDIS